jgi:DMSO reductase anchor subunit
VHPAPSVIAFTTLSGAGYGGLFWLGLLAPVGMTPDSPMFGAVALIVLGALITGGLLVSTLHLGHPERAWRAVSQWRTSWLAREGVAALLTYVPAVLFGLSWVVAGRQTGPPQGPPLGFGLAMSALAVVTVVCTAMIYASLKTIRQWHDPLVVPVYLMFAAASGGAVLCVLIALWSSEAAQPIASLGLAAGIGAWAVKVAYWRRMDRQRSASTAESATGLGLFGSVRLLEAPHTEENYLLREMGFRVARTHAVRLRTIALIVGGLLPAILQAGILAATIAVVPLAIAAALCMLAGILIERWLFFAEATHTVVLYYGRAA